MTEELEFDCGHGDLRLCLWRCAVHHGHPKDAPAQEARTAIRFTSRDEVDSGKNKIAFVKVDSEATMSAWAMGDLSLSTYTGQFGFLLIEGKENPGRYDQEINLAAHHWGPSYVPMVEKMRSQSQNILQTSGSDVGYQYATINSHMLGFGEPVRVKKGQHVLFRLLNASATENTMLALPGHSFRIIAMDGNPIIAILVISSGGACCGSLRSAIFRGSRWISSGIGASLLAALSNPWATAIPNVKVAQVSLSNRNPNVDKRRKCANSIAANTNQRTTIQQNTPPAYR
jgi:hypothetical protein